MNNFFSDDEGEEGDVVQADDHTSGGDAAVTASRGSGGRVGSVGVGGVGGVDTEVDVDAIPEIGRQRRTLRPKAPVVGGVGRTQAGTGSHKVEEGEAGEGHADASRRGVHVHVHGETTACALHAAGQPAETKTKGDEGDDSKADAHEDANANANTNANTNEGEGEDQGTAQVDTYSGVAVTEQTLPGAALLGDGSDEPPLTRDVGQVLSPAQLAAQAVATRQAAIDATVAAIRERHAAEEAYTSPQDARVLSRLQAQVRVASLSTSQASPSSHTRTPVTVDDVLGDVDDLDLDLDVGDDSDEHEPST